MVRLLDTLDQVDRDDQLRWQAQEIHKLMSHIDSRKCDFDFKDLQSVIKQILPALNDKYTEEQLYNYAGIYRVSR